MSAFYDIWVGNVAPKYGRYDNHVWQIGQLAGVWHNSLGNDASIVSEIDDEHYHLIVLGQFYETVDLDTLLNNSVAYVNSTESDFNDPAGHYVLLLFEKKTGSFHVFTNRLGTYHVYFLCDGKQGAVSTYCLGLARQASDKTLDWEGMTAFLSLGYFSNDNTYLKNIKIVAPASCYSFNPQAQLVSKRRYWDWTYSGSEKTEPYYIESLDDILRSSLSHSLKGKAVSVPISGGLDSRTLAGIVSHDGSAKSLWSYSYGYSEKSPEISIAEKIAKRRSMRFDSYVVPNYLFDNIDLITDSVELFQYIDGTRQAFVRKQLSEKSEVVLCGHWGDVWMDSMNIDGSLQETFQKKIVKRGSDWLLKNISGNFLTDGQAYLKDYFNSFVSRYAHINDSDFVMKIYKTDQWSFRWTLPSIRMYQAAVFPVLPFYDKRIVDLFSTIPSHMLTGRQLQISYLKKFYPDLARVQWQEYGTNLYWYKHFNNRNLGYRAIKKAQRMLSVKKHIQRNWEVFYLNKEGEKNLRNVLQNNSSLESVVSRKAIENLIDDFYRNPSAANGYSISMLHTLAHFLNRIS